MKKEVGIGVLVALGVGIWAWSKSKVSGEPDPPAQGLGNLYGKVTDAVTGQGLSGVSVVINTAQAMTNGSGDYSFLNLPLGEFTVVFQKAGYETVTF